MEEFLTASRKEDGKLVMDEFSWTWFGGKFSEKERKGVYNVCNLMLDKRKRAFPDFRNYLFTVSQFVKSKYQNEESFESWQDIVIKLINGKDKKAFADYLEACNTLFDENLLYKSASNSWAANNGNYVFGFDSLPTIEFEALTLTCYSKGDSSIIKNTKGIYYPTEALWYGEGGVVNWERAGFSSDTVYAEIDNYHISFKSPTYSIKNVTFYDYKYFKEPMKGLLEDKVLANVTEEKATYPRFDSYDVRLEIPNIAEGVDYIGGFSLYGRKVIGRGTDELEALDFGSIGLFPNPNTGKFYLEIQKAEHISQLQIKAIELWDMEGRMVKDLNVKFVGEHFLASYDFEDIQPGMYFIKVKNNTGVGVKKFVVQK